MIIDILRSRLALDGESLTGVASRHFRKLLETERKDRQLKKIRVRYNKPPVATSEWPRGTTFSFEYFTGDEPRRIDVLCSQEVFLRQRRPTSVDDAASVSRNYARQRIEKRLRNGQLDAYEKAELKKGKYEELELLPLGQWESFEVAVTSKT